MYTVGMFIEGTFIPSFEGATRRFQLLARLFQQNNIKVIIFHCYRGWSDPNRIAQEKFSTYFIPPDDYYHNVDLILKLIRRHRIDAFVMSEFEPIVRLGGHLKKSFPETRLFFEIHDIHSDMNRSVSATGEHVARTKIAERAAYLLSDLCICFSEEDRSSASSIVQESVDWDLWRDAFQNSSDTERQSFNIYSSMKEDNLISRVVQLPFGHDNPNVSNIVPNMVPKTLLFLGNMYHTPNRKAVEFLAKSVYDQIVSSMSDVRFLLAGDAPQDLIDSCEKDNFTFLGRVENLGEVFQKVTLALAPMFFGAGIRVKILDYLSSGVPVIGTSLAVRGLNINPNYRDAVVIEDDPDKFAAKVLSTLSSSERLLQMSDQGRQLAESYSWLNIAEQTLEMYRDYLANERNDGNLEQLISLSDHINMTSYFYNQYLNPGRFKNLTYPHLEGVWQGGQGTLTRLSI